MAEPKGSIVVDELILPIVDIHLDYGAIVFTAEVRGPVRAVSTGSYVVCDRSGGALYRSQGEAGRISWAELAAGPTLRIQVDLHIESKQATPTGPAVTLLGFE